MLREIRTLVDIPVTGYSDTVFHLSKLYGQRFGLLFFNVEREDFWIEQIASMGLRESFAGYELLAFLFRRSPPLTPTRSFARVSSPVSLRQEHEWRRSFVLM